MPHAFLISNASTPAGHRSRALVPWILAWMLCLACGGSPPQPSILLVVFDTTRVDAVSAYGHVEGTTPHLDALAASGLRYTQAYSQANWTVPSHASLFVGLLPSEHGVVSFTAHLDDSYVTLAERLRAHGYETVAVNENPFVGVPSRGLSQGFDHFVTIEYFFTKLSRERSRRRKARPARSRFMVKTVERWLADRSTDRPFFLFLNIMDAHAPYKVRDANPHLPADVSTREARAVSQRARDHQCQTPRRSREMEILWALYLGGVSAADQKLERVLKLLQRAGANENLIIIVTADHGEHFGEQRLFLHDIGVHQPLIHVPLIVHGLPGVSPAVIDTPVQLLDLLPSVLAWAGVGRVTGLPGRSLPTQRSAQDRRRVIISEYIDPLYEETQAILRQGIAQTRRACGPADKVSGDARAALRWPHKLIWYERHQDELYDLGVDPLERMDTAATTPHIVTELEAALPPPWSPPRDRPRDTPETPPDPELLEALRALGYLDDAEEHEEATDEASEK